MPRLRVICVNTYAAFGLQAALLGHAHLAKILLAWQANPDLVDHDDRRTAFHWACRQGHTDVAVALVQAGCDVTIKDAEGFTGHQWAELSAEAHRNGLLPALERVAAKECDDGIEEACPPPFYALLFGIGICAWTSIWLWKIPVPGDNKVVQQRRKKRR